ncbi:hypothetical protein RJ640_024404 [Escallonia rubra]|uniref:NOSIC domain-containing protein n=1 Tax=Escallonia rubra TaxID=112253 RepID=A0AA88RUG1_9ASTE|nr:hypothetical protein RJ640_024404 [Escallonia rubra]
MNHQADQNLEMVDVIIIQAIAKMDEVDKELNNSSMRLREWYGWHFTELAKIVQENTVYAKTVKLMGDRTNSIKLDFSEASAKHKGKISRSLAAKTALAIRCDALGGDQDNSMGLENRVKIESRLRNLEGRELGRSAGSAKGKSNMEPYNKDRKKGEGMLISPAKSYNPTADSVIEWKESAAAKKEEHMALIKAPVIDEGKKEKKRKKAEAEDAGLQNDVFVRAQPESGEAGMEVKKKKKKQAAEGRNVKVRKEEKKKKHAAEDDGQFQREGQNVEVKKKRRKHADPGWVKTLKSQ